MPWRPSTQSIASRHGSKFARRVREQDKDEMRAEGIGEKRVSSKADVRE
jgi:hypothetical protein